MSCIFRSKQHFININPVNSLLTVQQWATQRGISGIFHYNGMTENFGRYVYRRRRFHLETSFYSLLSNFLNAIIAPLHDPRASTVCLLCLETAGICTSSPSIWLSEALQIRRLRWSHCQLLHLSNFDPILRALLHSCFRLRLELG